MDNNIEKIDLDRVDWKSSREFFESLGEALDRLDDKDESYNFTWVGKRKSIVEAGAPINKILRPDMEASKDFDNTKNMLIVGDNLDALKLLQESYLGKIKMIYIDPPYNTGHDFVYRDNFTIKKEDFSDSIKDSDGNIIVSEDEYIENAKVNGRFHSDWLSMIYPRLKLARNLFTDDGVIFLSIDDKEIANLKKVCDEVFGDDNFIACLTRVTKKGGKSSEAVAKNHDFALIYAKDISDKKLSGISHFDSGFNKTDEFADKRGPYKLNQTLDYNTLQYNKTMDFIIEIDGKKYVPGGDEAKQLERHKGNHGQHDWVWRWSLEKFKFGYENGWIIVSKTGRIYTKTYLNATIAGNPKDGYYIDYQDRSKAVSTLELTDNKYSNDNSAKEIERLMGSKVFDYVKPTELVDLFLEMNNSKDCTILDFFAGSGTTGHAVMQKNAADNGMRNFILVQLNEEIDSSSEASKAGFSTIDEVTAERLRRAGDKIQDEQNSVKIDSGFRVLRIDSSNENDDIRKPLNQINQFDLFSTIDNIKKDRTPLDLLFGVIYASALPFDLKLETRKIGENTVYLYGYLDEGTGLVACFDDNIPEETIKEIANLKALTAAFKDSSFAGSAAKINLSEHFRIISPDTKVKVI